MKGSESKTGVAALKLKSRERMEVYRRLFLLNRSFTRVIQLLDELSQNPLFKARDLREMRGLAQEVQLEINVVLLNPLESAELNDWTRFGKVRKEMERKLRGKK
jgi:hypothetical protein